MGKFKILIADNNEGIVASYTDALVAAGYEVVDAASPEEALTILRKQMIHLAIVDVRLREDDDQNDKSGLELCEAMEPLVPRVILTGYVEDWTIIRDALQPSGRPKRKQLADGFFFKGAKEKDARNNFYREIRRILQQEYEMIPAKRFAILTSGGDAPGMNAAIWSAVRTALANNVEILGVQDGYRGLINNNMRKLTWNSVSDIMIESGTILGSARCDEFHDKETRKQAVDNILQKHISGLLVIGGDGSMKGAQALAHDVAEKGTALQTIAIPGTIDNDLVGSDFSLGAASAANAMIDQIRQIVAPAKALNMVFVIEVMGALSGFLAVESGIGVGADAVIIPEELIVLLPGEHHDWREAIDLPATKSRVDQRLEEISENLKKAFEAGKKFGFIIQAEGLDHCTATLIDKTAERLERLDAEYTRRHIDERFTDWFGSKVHPVRVQKLGYAVRGVLPSRFDIWLGAASGKRAVELLLAGSTSMMVGWSETRGFIETHFDEVVSKSGRAPNEMWKDRSNWSAMSDLQKSLSLPLPFSEAI